MAKLSKEELKNKISEVITDEDLAISLLEDIEDSVDVADNSELEEIKALKEELENNMSELESKYSDLKTKYKERFLSSNEEDTNNDEDDDEPRKEEVIDIQEI